MKLKKIVSTLLIASSGFNLVACDGSENSMGNKTTKKIKINGVEQTVQNSAINDVSDVWFAIPGKDMTSNNARASFLLQNNTSNQISLVGCDSDGVDTSKAGMSIDSNASLKINARNGLVLSQQQQESPNVMELSFNDSQSQKWGYCYYKVYMPKLDKSVYFKLNVSSENYSTQSSIFQSIDRPYNELKEDLKVNNPDWFRAVVNTTVPLAAAGGTASGLWYKNLSLVTQKKLRDAAVDKFFNNAVELQQDMYDRTLEKIKMIQSISNVKEQDKAWHEFYEEISQTDISQGGPRFVVKTQVTETEFINNCKNLDRFEARNVYNTINWRIVPVDKNGEVIGKVRGFNTPKEDYWIEGSQSFAADIANKNSNIYKTREFFKEYLDGHPNANISSAFDVTSELATDIVIKAKEKGIANALEATSFVQTNLTTEDYGVLPNPKFIKSAIDDSSAKKSSMIFEEYVDDKMETKFVFKGVDAVLEKMGVRSTFAITMITSGVGALVEAVSWFGIQPALSMLFFPDATGQFSTRLAHGSLSVPTFDEVNTWNKSHSDKQMTDSSVNVGSGINTYRNTLTIAPKTADGELIDKSSTFTISMNMLTSPFKRGDKIEGHDSYDERITSNTDGSSVFAMEFSELGGDNLSERSFTAETTKQIYNNAGIGGMSYNLVDAPEVKQTKISNYQGSLSNFVRTSGRLLNSSTGSSPGLALRKVGNIEGLFMKPGQVVTLGLKIADNLKLDGNGYSLAYVPNNLITSESMEIGSYHIVKSSSLFDKENALGSHVLLATFDKPFPYKLSDVVNLNLAISGTGGLNALNSSGKLYIGDNYGATMSVPIYLNYALLAEPNGLSANTGEDTSFVVANVSEKTYKSLSIIGLPEGAKITSVQATNALNPGEQRTIAIDLSNVTKIGNYDITIQGYDGTTTRSNDIQTVSLTVTKGW